jgi:hypothetical protein
MYRWGAMGGRHRCQAIQLTTPFIDLPGTSGWHDYCICAYRQYRNIVRPEKSQQAFTVLAAATELEIYDSCSSERHYALGGCRKMRLHTTVKPTIHSEVLPGILCMSRLTEKHTARSTNDYRADVVATLASEEIVAA